MLTITSPGDLISSTVKKKFSTKGSSPKYILITTCITTFLCYFYEMIWGLGCPDTLCEGVYYYRNADFSTSQARWMVRYINELFEYRNSRAYRVHLLPYAGSQCIYHMLHDPYPKTTGADSHHFHDDKLSRGFTSSGLHVHVDRLFFFISHGRSRNFSFAEEKGVHCHSGYSVLSFDDGILSRVYRCNICSGYSSADFRYFGQ